MQPLNSPLAHKRNQYLHAMHTLQQEADTAAEHRQQATPESIAELQQKLDAIAEQFQDDNDLGQDRDKMYLVQATIHYIRGNETQTQVFIGAAEEVHGGSFAAATKLRRMLSANDIEPLAGSAGSENNQQRDDGELVNPLEQPIATSGKRFLTFIVDLIAYYSFTFFAAFVIGMYSALMGSVDYFTNEATGEATAFTYILSFTVFFAYYVFCEVSYGQTIGKRIAGTRVVTMDGGPITVKQAIIRTLCRFIPFYALSMLGNRPRGWHDQLSGTKVIEVA